MYFVTRNSEHYKCFVKKMMKKKNTEKGELLAVVLFISDRSSSMYMQTNCH